jgi:hypothetical protein
MQCCSWGGCHVPWSSRYVLFAAVSSAILGCSALDDLLTPESSGLAIKTFRAEPGQVTAGSAAPCGGGRRRLGHDRQRRHGEGRGRWGGRLHDRYTLRRAQARHNDCWSVLVEAEPLTALPHPLVTLADSISVSVPSPSPSATPTPAPSPRPDSHADSDPGRLRSRSHGASSCRLTVGPRHASGERVPQDHPHRSDAGVPGRLQHEPRAALRRHGVHDAA